MSVSYITKYMVGMFSYGFLRAARAEYKEPYDTLGKKIVSSTGNGIVYASPFGLPHLVYLIDRIDVYVSGKKSEKYDAIYKECSGLCKNKNVLF
jgi:hypothetical protein